MRPFKRKSETQLKGNVQRAGTWEVGQGKLGKQVLSTRFDRRFDAMVGNPAYGHKVGVAVPTAHMPTGAEGSLLNGIEDALWSALEADQKSMMVGVLTLPSLRQIYLPYVRT